MEAVSRNSRAKLSVRGKSKLKVIPEPDPRIQHYRVHTNHGRIVRTRKLTYDTLEIVVKSEEQNFPIIGVAGQYAALTTPDLLKPRSYSFAKAPESENEGEHTFFVRLIHGGEFSGWLFKEDRTGAPITMIGPLGKFILEDSNDPMLCIAGGSGLSVIKAILEHAANLSLERDALFLYGARTQADLYCIEEIEEIKRRWNGNYKFEYVNVLSNELQDSDWSGATGLVTDYFKDAYIASDKFDIENARVYMCGPPPMIDAGVDALKKEGLTEERIYFDKFEDASSPPPVIDNSKCVLCDECLLVKPMENCIVETANFVMGPDNQIKNYQRVEPAHTSGLYYNSLYIDERECIRCMACVDRCPTSAISPSNTVKIDVIRNMDVASS